MSSNSRPGTRASLSRVGRALRYLAGVDERLLDKVHQERAWYAALGGAVLGTAVFAAASMSFAIEEVVDSVNLMVLPPAVLWFFIILNLDRWIVTSRAYGGWRRVGMLLTRAVLAVLVGVVIAEPLVLRVFENKIEEYVQQQRSQHLDDLRGRLVACNPDPTDQRLAKPSNCSADDLINFSGTAAADADELAHLRKDADDLQKSIDKDSAILRGLNEKARKECVGESGAGLTGVVGWGKECQALHDEADQYAATHRIEPRIVELERKRSHIVDLETTVNAGRKSYLEIRQAEIGQRLAEETQVDADIGLLERMDALGAISSDSGTLALGIMLVRLLFIAVDLTPVLMKMTSGRTAYDQLVSDRLRGVIEDERRTREEDRQDKERERSQRIDQQRVTEHVQFQQAVDRLADVYEHSDGHRRTM